MARDPVGYFERCQRQRGDPFVVRLPSVGEVLVTGHPEGARDVFSAAPEVFEPLRSNPVEPLLGRGSLILLAGERHRRERRLMAPPFHGERMRAYGAIIQELALEELGTWRSGGKVVAQEAMRRITLDVILRAVFGVEGEGKSLFRAAIGALLDAYTAPLMMLPALRRRLWGLGPWARFERARDHVHALLHEEIAARRARGVEGREDILSLLMAARYEDGSALAEDELIDELRTLLVAGHETTATSLVWALFYAHRDPRVLTALRAELSELGPDPSPEALAQLPYLGAVCSEALRVHPVVPIAVRRAARPFSLRGVDVAPGGSVAVAITLLHAHPDAWPEPRGFAPERFLGRKVTPFEYAPYGGGARRCVGAAFAAYEMRIVLGTLMASAHLELASPRVPRLALSSITMGPAEPVRLRVLRRVPPSPAPQSTEGAGEQRAGSKGATGSPGK